MLSTVVHLETTNRINTDFFTYIQIQDIFASSQYCHPGESIFFKYFCQILIVNSRKLIQCYITRVSLGVTRMDKIRNEYIRGTAQFGRFGEKTREARLDMYGGKMIGILGEG